jgi:amidase
MNPTDIAFASALDQAAWIRQKQISPLELTQLYLARIEQWNPYLGSFFTIAAEQAIADAQRKTEMLMTVNDLDALPPFFGVAIAMKDLNSVAGLRCTFGNRAMMEHQSIHDDAVVTRCKTAGFTILGKTATSEVGSMPFTEPMGFPPARNPWNWDYTSGGSSGGAAASVAAGLTAIAQGSDGGGSIRGPAFCCGVVGIKPSRGRVSYAPIGDCLSGIATNGPIARTVADAAALLDVMAGYVVGDPYWLPDPVVPFHRIAVDAAQQDALSPRRIAYSTAIAPIGEADVTCRQAVLETAQRLEALGHFVEPIELDVTGLAESFQVVWRTGVLASGIPVHLLEPMNQWLANHGDTSGTYQQAVWTMQRLARQLVTQLHPYDACLLPVYLHPPIQIGQWQELTPSQVMERIIQWIAPCPLANATGQPAIAFPTGFTSTGLPLGVQLMGRPADEATIIAIASQLSHHYPVEPRYPEL